MPDEEVGRSIGMAFAQGYHDQLLRQTHAVECDAQVGDWMGELCDLAPRSCPCWCHLLGQSGL